MRLNRIRFLGHNNHRLQRQGKILRRWGQGLKHGGGDAVNPSLGIAGCIVRFDWADRSMHHVSGHGEVAGPVHEDILDDMAEMVLRDRGEVLVLKTTRGPHSRAP